MIKGIGIDLIELDRIQKSMEKNNRFVDRILTQNEKNVFDELKSNKRKVEFLAGRYASKEAFAKATGTGIGRLSFHDMELTVNEKGAPSIKAAGYEEHIIFVSITHSRDYAAAQVVIEVI
ncbi:holo-[acyl-carrier protein] synthase [Virgibacillus natechei]|uniref:Holo-[acyl-carrier-protein] synthase n=1 Tax=Virgibacillus natechei TaxID=1216297 RepID=A0ABS4IKG9_9BACI|nr:holo-ACP synthase [Virgibacillus natechei]MBP1971455.1 holo-[acyl-carrier protein] synthase [Virgibacillus natechei]UZD13823.1 holo-ACP synthase [Virgibacillus natechei]